MKLKFFAVLATLMISNLALAAEEDAIKAFSESTEVSAKIKDFRDNKRSVSKNIGAAFISGSCGFAGCSSTYVVSQAVSTTGVNKQSTAVVAVIELMGSKTLSVTVLDKPSAILELK